MQHNENIGNVGGSDFVNCSIFRADNTDSFKANIKKCYENNTFFWVDTIFIVGETVDGAEAQVYDDWKDRLEQCVEIIKSTGMYNYFLGWYMDEPGLCGFSREFISELSKYNHDTYGKRFFVTFAVAEIAPETFGFTNDTPMTREYSEYITDASYDLYWDVNTSLDKYEACNTKLHAAVPDNCRIWYIPWQYALNSMTKDEAQQLESKRIDHTNKMYEFLKAEQNPGGLMCFLFNGSVNVFYGIEEMVSDGKWLDLFALDKQIGKEICSGAFRK